MKFFNDFCNFLLKAITSLLTHGEDDKLNWRGANTAIALVLLLLNSK